MSAAASDVVRVSAGSNHRGSLVRLLSKVSLLECVNFVKGQIDWPFILLPRKGNDITTHAGVNSPHA